MVSPFWGTRWRGTENRNASSGASSTQAESSFHPPQLHSVATNSDTGLISHEAGQAYVLDLLLVHRLKDWIKGMFSRVLIRQLFNGMD